MEPNDAQAESSLMLASSSVFCVCKMWLDFSRTNCFLVRSNVHISWVELSGTKLARIGPCASRSPHYPDAAPRHALGCLGRPMRVALLAPIVVEIVAAR